MPTSVLLDTSFLVALYDPTDKHHTQAIDFLAVTDHIQLVAQVVLPETAFMLEAHVGEHAVLRFWESLDSPEIQLEPIVKADLRRARELRVQYVDAHLDFVDCCIIALAERLNITQICTFDRRDFALVRPSHAEYLELLP